MSTCSDFEARALREPLSTPAHDNDDTPPARSEFEYERQAREAALMKSLERYARQCLPDRGLNYPLLAQHLLARVDDALFATNLSFFEE